MIYNPAAGARRERRLRDVEAVLAVLRASGVDPQLIPTHGPGAATGQAREAALGGCDTVICCGGDGTANEILQGIAGTQAALGIVPLGTGNVIANGLGMPGEPAAAARALLAAEVKTVTAGRMSFHHKHQPGTRLFAAAAGIGPDAQIMYEMSSHGKGRFGMAAYYAKATQIWLRHELVPFTVEYTESATGERRQETVYQVLAIRSGHFGALLGRIVPEASLERHDLALLLLRRKSKLRITQYVLQCLLRRRWSVPGIGVVFATEAECAPLPGPSPEKEIHRRGAPRLYAEVDGEVVGMPPARLDVLRDAYRLLVPRNDSRS